MMIDDRSATESMITEIAGQLGSAVSGGLDDLSRRAYEIKTREVGRVVYFRGIIELSNHCRKNCLYCGIRRDNHAVERYSMSEEEILQAASFAHDAGYGSIVLQSGERTDASFIRFIENILAKIKGSAFSNLGITLSLGEQTDETYRRWYGAGADRYLLRIETSNPNLYAKLHPADHRFENRIRCLNNIREIGYQVGTGVMIGLPGQTFEDLAADLLFFKQIDADMIGMGPYLPHQETPLGKDAKALDESATRQLMNLSLGMIAATRIQLRNINIAATTALQAIHPTGREMGLLAGANVVMPNITPTRYRSSYKLYEGKPCLDENETMCRHCLDRRIAMIGEQVAYNQLGDSLHFTARLSSEH